MRLDLSLSQELVFILVLWTLGLECLDNSPNSFTILRWKQENQGRWTPIIQQKCIAGEFGHLSEMQALLTPGNHPPVSLVYPNVWKMSGFTLRKLKERGPTGVIWGWWRTFTCVVWFADTVTSISLMEGPTVEASCSVISGATSHFSTVTVSSL